MSKKKFRQQKQNKGRNEIRELFDSLLAFIGSMEGKAYAVPQIAKKLQVKKQSLINELYEMLDSLVYEGKLDQLSNGSYKPAKSAKGIVGIVDHVNPRFAYVVTGEEGQKDIYVQTRDLGDAMHGDTVRVQLLSGKRSGSSPEGKVVELIKRGRNRFVGKLEVSKNYGFVVPDFKKMYQDFFIYPENLNNAKHNDKVLIEVTKWAAGDKNPEAKVVEILGKTGENNAEIHSIMAEFDLPFRFPENVLRESEKISEGITGAEVAKRKDFRNVLTFTIDPEDAKDFDDAISFQQLPNGRYEIGVHIADVTHYVVPGTVLDDDAFDRATSVYLVDRTVPMLPERLSNALCSLRPHEDKLTFAAVFEMDDKGKVHKEWFGRTIIHS
ncbi:MAG: ribonuclease R family protein, partial [Cytophagales bacterium]